jgi:hypothetical protein
MDAEVVEVVEVILELEFEIIKPERFYYCFQIEDKNDSFFQQIRNMRVAGLMTNQHYQCLGSDSL